MPQLLQLLQLPDEIVCNVLKACSLSTDAKGRLGPTAPGRHDLMNFGRTCRKAHGLTEPFLFSSLLLRCKSHVANLRRLLDEDEKRKKDVKDVVLAPFVHETSAAYREVTSILPELPNLEHLFVEIPYRHLEVVDEDDPEPWATLQQTLGAPQVSGIGGCPIPAWSGRLVSCYLNFQGVRGGLSPLGTLAYVLFAPRLRSLTLVAASIEDLKLGSHKAVHVSPLEKLQLHCCYFSPRGISQLLSIPTALTAISYFPLHSIIDLGADHLVLLATLNNLLRSLSTYQRQSLTSLSIDLSGLSSINAYESTLAPTSHISLSRLTSVTHLRLSVDDRLSTGIQPFLSRLPASITDLQIEDKLDQADSSWLVDSCRTLCGSGWPPPANQTALRIPRIPQIALPLLRKLTVSLAPCLHAPFDHPLPRFPLALQSDFAQLGHVYRYRYSSAFRKQPIHFKVYRRSEMMIDAAAVPPYLWDEYVREYLPVYDNYSGENWKLETEVEKRNARIEKERAEDSRRAFEAQEAAALAAAQAQAQAEVQAQAQAEVQAQAQAEVQAQAQAQAVISNAGLAVAGVASNAAAMAQAQAQAQAQAMVSNAGLTVAGVGSDTAAMALAQAWAQAEDIAALTSPGPVGIVLGQTNTA